MHHKFIPALIGLLVIAGTGGLAYWQYQAKPLPMAQETPSADTDKAYSAAEVAAHNISSDCWAIINGGVYDLTSWIPQHPGGERAIEGLCGKDGSAAFNGQHGGGATQQAILAERKVGIVAQ